MRPAVAGEIGTVLLGPSRLDRLSPARPSWQIEIADSPAALAEYRRLRYDVFVAEQGLFTGADRDEIDDDRRSVVLVARDADRQMLGGVRLAPMALPDIGWWRGSRLAVRREVRGAARGVGSALVKAACAHAELNGAIRFDATVQADNEELFARLGWESLQQITVAGCMHILMHWPIDRFGALARRSKYQLGPLLAGLAGDIAPGRPGGLGGLGWIGDDGAPVPNSELIAACDAIVPSLVERDPEWAGWCGVLVNVNDLSAMGAEPVGLLDAIGARDASFAARIIAGLRDAAMAWRVPVLGGHTQLGVPAALSITALGRTTRPVPGGGGRPGQDITVTADLGGGWRPGFTGSQWDSTTTRSGDELAQMASFVARSAPSAAKDISMAGLVGTLGMLAESSGCGATLDVIRVPVPTNATAADWLGCFSGFGMLTTDVPGRPVAPAGPATSAVCGQLRTGSGVDLLWPDGVVTPAVGEVTRLGAAVRLSGAADPPGARTGRQVGRSW